MRSLLITALILSGTFSVAQGIGGKAGIGGSAGLGGGATVSAGITLVQTCISGQFAAATTCGTANAGTTGSVLPAGNFTSGQTIIVLVRSAAAAWALALPTMSGAGCPSALTPIIALTTTSGLYNGTTQAGACTFTETPTGTGNNVWMAFTVISGLAGTFDTPVFSTNSCFTTNCTATSETPAANNSIVCGFVGPGTNAITGLNTGSPFNLTSPNQFNNALSANNLTALISCFNQTTAAAAQIGYSTSVSTTTWYGGVFSAR